MQPACSAGPLSRLGLGVGSAPAGGSSFQQPALQRCRQSREEVVGQKGNKRIGKRSSSRKEGHEKQRENQHARRRQG